MIKKLILVRHGESHGNVDRSAYEKFPDYAIRLTKKGAEQAREAGKKISLFEGNFNVFLSSYFRTRQTFDFAKESFEDRIVSIQESSLIREQEWNGLRMSPYDDNAERFRNNVGSFYYRFDHAESGADVYNRMLLFHELKMLPHLKNEGAAENVLVVAHGYSLRVYLKILLGMNVEDFEMMRNFRNAEIIELEYEDGNFTLKSKLNIRPKRTSKFSYNKDDLA